MNTGAEKYDRQFEPFLDELETIIATLVETGDVTGLKIFNQKVAICMALGCRLMIDQQRQEGNC
jgi:hypothetical protein